MSKTVISIEGVTKTFGSVRAVDDISLELQEGEFFALLGPSGCGKTTLLRILAGFEEPDAGRILLDGQDLTPVRPNKRPLNLMFQSYALFPHMTVEKNVAYGLEMENLGKAEIARRTAEVLEMTQLSALAKRRPDQLSGGQKQRVALARALVKRPRVLLLDEPLGALDKKLRETMQLELKRLQQETGITFVVVTHDQEEALVMADRIAVLKEGRVAQLGAPRALYEQPANRFVAGFIGGMNFIEGEVAEAGLKTAGGHLLRGERPKGLAVGAAAVLAMRPERLSLYPDDATVDSSQENLLVGKIEKLAYLGQDLTVFMLCQDGEQLVARLPAGEAERLDWKIGQRVTCAWAPRHSRILSD